MIVNPSASQSLQTESHAKNRGKHLARAGRDKGDKNGRSKSSFYFPPLSPATSKYHPGLENSIVSVAMSMRQSCLPQLSYVRHCRPVLSVSDRGIYSVAQQRQREAPGGRGGEPGMPATNTHATQRSHVFSSPDKGHLCLGLIS